MASNRERNIEMARKGYQAFNELHLDEAMETIADDIVWHAGGENPISGEYKGKQAVMELFMKYGQLTEGTSEFDIHDILASEDHTVVLGTAPATRHGRPPHEPVRGHHPRGQGRQGQGVLALRRGPGRGRRVL